MKRYLVFAGDRYQPLGGWDDFKNDYETRDEAIASLQGWFAKTDFGWVEVVDTEKKAVICTLKSNDKF